jgi:hypothetical protein
MSFWALRPTVGCPIPITIAAGRQGSKTSPKCWCGLMSSSNAEPFLGFQKRDVSNKPEGDDGHSNLYRRRITKAS